MLSKYQSQQTTIDQFDKTTLSLLKPYFHMMFASDDKIPWFHNLLEIAKHNLALAHCIQHNATARYLLETCSTSLLSNDFHDTIGCYSSVKSQDTLKLENNRITGKKYWVSNLHVADFGIMRIPTQDAEAYLMFDFHHLPHVKTFECDQIGLEMARPGTFEVRDYELSSTHILGQRDYSDNQSPFVKILNFHDYCFVTNYLGCLMGLYSDIKSQAEGKKFDITLELNRFKLGISSLKMLWEDNLFSVDATAIDDRFWHRRNTQYTQSKDLLISLVGLALQVADSTWMMSRGAHNQKFRDALVFCSHMQPLCKGLADKHFVEW